MQYVGANVPQAWAAGAPFMLLQTMLGIVPDAPRNRLYVDPALPAWLPDVTLVDLRLGHRTFDVSFWREGEETKFKVLRGDPRFVEHRSILEAKLLAPPRKRARAHRLRVTDD